MSETTYYQRNKEIMLDIANEYQNNKEVLKEKANMQIHEYADTWKDLVKYHYQAKKIFIVT